MSGSIKCYGCGSELEVKNPTIDVNYNDDLELGMEIVPCSTCISEAYEVGKDVALEEKE